MTAICNPAKRSCLRRAITRKPQLRWLAKKAAAEVAAAADAKPEGQDKDWEGPTEAEAELAVPLAEVEEAEAEEEGEQEGALEEEAKALLEAAFAEGQEG